MSMSDVERAAIDAALRETHAQSPQGGRDARESGERTLYPQIKEYAID